MSPLVCVLAGVLLAVTARAAPLDSERYPPPGELVSIGTHRLHIRCLGEGTPTVILEAGLGGTVLDWLRVQPEGARLTRVCAYDRGGYGWSERGPAPRTATVLADELARLLPAAGLSPPYVLVGHSFGGLVVRMYAQRLPQQVAGLILVDATHEDQFDRLSTASINTAPLAGRTFVLSNHEQVPAALPVEVQPLAQALALGPDAITALYDELRNMPLSARQVQQDRRLPPVPLRVLMHDSLTRAASERARQMAAVWRELQTELASRSPQGALQVVADSGHHIHLEQPAAVIAAIRTVLSAPASAQERYRVEIDGSSFAEVVADIEFAIGEHNFRLTGHNAIGAALAEREGQPFPPGTVLHFCNLDYARQLLEIDPDYLLHMPCRVAISAQADKIIVETTLVPVLDARAAGLAADVNAILRAIVDFPKNF